jgi:hypothetical protein
MRLVFRRVGWKFDAGGMGRFRVLNGVRPEGGDRCFGVLETPCLVAAGEEGPEIRRKRLPYATAPAGRLSKFSRGGYRSFPEAVIEVFHGGHRSFHSRRPPPHHSRPPPPPLPIVVAPWRVVGRRSRCHGFVVAPWRSVGPRSPTAKNTWPPRVTVVAPWRARRRLR